MGIETVYQDLALCDNLDVVANLYLGREAQQTVVPGLVKQLDETQMEARTNQILRQLDVKIPSVRTIVASLSGGQRQSIAVAKTVLRDPAVLLLDEPTAALGVAQTRQVLNLIGRLREQGLAVVMISHNLADVFEVADRVVVLRLGAARRVVRDRGDLLGADRRGNHGRPIRRHHACGGDRNGRPARGIGGGAMSSETLDTQELLPPPPTKGMRPPSALTRRLRGDLGQIPVVLALVIIAVYFQIATGGNFLRARNLTEMIQEIITIGTLALGSVLVLLVREIDLSLGSVSGLGAGAMGVLSYAHGVPWPIAILIGLLVGALAGAINGFFISVVRVPAFIVTLAALIGYQGLLLHIMLPTTTLPIQDPKILDIATTYLPSYAGVGIPVIGVIDLCAHAHSGARETPSRAVYRLSPRRNWDCASASSPLWRLVGHCSSSRIAVSR